jgi:hypothetical protein
MTYNFIKCCIIQAMKKVTQGLRDNETERLRDGFSGTGRSSKRQMRINGVDKFYYP